MHTNTAPGGLLRPRGLLALALFVSVLIVVGLRFPSQEEELPSVHAALVHQSTDSASQAQTAREPIPWYSTPWAVAVFGLAAVGTIIFVLRRRTAYYERKQERLERLVAERTDEVRKQKQQLETYNRELLQTNETLRQTLQEKSKLLGMAAHDLKNPLFGIRALSEIVLEADQLPPNHERKLNLIRESAHETLHLIDDLLASAAGSAQSELNEEDVDVAALAQWVVRSFEPQAQRKDQVLHCSVVDAPCAVRGDKRKLREAISNLVSNALKYSPPGEAVTVEVARQEEVVRVVVEDSGPGMSKSDQQRMFVPFQPLSTQPTGGETSSGLGLYIVKQVVDLHDGTIDVDSTPGEGSTFILTLPATTPDTPPVPETDPTDLGVDMKPLNS